VAGEFAACGIVHIYNFLPVGLSKGIIFYGEEIFQGADFSGEILYWGVLARIPMRNSSYVLLSLC